MRFIIVALCAIAAASPHRAPAESLTLEGVLALAKTNAPAIRALHAESEERSALAMGGALRLPDNPELGVAGRRRGEQSFGDEYELALTQPLSGLFSHSKRDALARATSGVAALEAASAERALLLEVADSFLRLADAERRVVVAEDLQDDAARLEESVRARFDAGDVAKIDVNLARAESLRASAVLAVASAEAGEARALLLAAVGLSPGSRIEASDEALRAPPEIGEIGGRIAGLPEVRALDEAIEAARAEAELATAFHATGWSLGISVGKEEGDDVVEAGVGVSLPFFERRQASTAAATARLRRAESERAALVLRLAGAVESTAAAYRALHASMQSIDTELIPLLEENVALAVESWEAGRIGLADLILVRRDLLAARIERSEHWRRTRESEVRLRFLTGDLP